MMALVRMRKNLAGRTPSKINEGVPRAVFSVGPCRLGVPANFAGLFCPFAFEQYFYISIIAFGYLHNSWRQ